MFGILFSSLATKQTLLICSTLLALSLTLSFCLLILFASLFQVKMPKKKVQTEQFLAEEREVNRRTTWFPFNSSLVLAIVVVVSFFSPRFSTFSCLLARRIQDPVPNAKSNLKNEMRAEKKPPSHQATKKQPHSHQLISSSMRQFLQYSSNKQRSSKEAIPKMIQSSKKPIKHTKT